MLFLHKIPFFLPYIYPDYLWRIKTEEKKIYLTFDDGPIPEITEFVLEMLEKYQAKATFFCIGDNIRKHPDIFWKIVGGQHRIGNHTYNHLNGWKTETAKYVENALEMRNQYDSTKALSSSFQFPVSNFPLFRPPYGRITRPQAKALQELGYQIVMWDVLSGDFSPTLSSEKCLEKTIQSTRAGSIVVFHDSIKASKNMMYALPKFLEHFSELGYRFESL